MAACGCFLYWLGSITCYSRHFLALASLIIPIVRLHNYNDIDYFTLKLMNLEEMCNEPNLQGFFHVLLTDAFLHVFLLLDLWWLMLNKYF